MPDIFIPADTSFNSKLYTNLVRKGILNRFTTDYALKHRDAMKATYPTFIEYNKSFVVTDEFVEGLKQAAQEGKVEWNDEQFARSEKFIRLQIKALIARNVWEMQQYYEVIISEDTGVQKAMEVLSNDKEYNKLLR